MLKKYYQLTKPGIVYGNLLTTVAAFFFATRWHVSSVHLSIAVYVFIATIIGIGLIIASACVFNNYLDRDIDKKMTRTEGRALVTGEISAKSALVFATVLGLLGVCILASFVNYLTAIIGLFGFIFYVIIYGYAKRASYWGTIVGSISGAVPIVVGYTAVTGRLDTEALILFLILALWQMPHFYAIATYRLDEYTAAGIPVLPAKKGMYVTKVNIVSYMIAFVIAELLLWGYGFAGWVYLASVVIFGGVWLEKGFRGFRKDVDDAKWARKVFSLSLVVLLAFCVTIAVAPLFP